MSLEMDNSTPHGMINQLHGQVVAHRKMIEEFTNANLEQYSKILILNQKVQEQEQEIKDLKLKLEENKPLEANNQTDQGE